MRFLRKQAHFTRRLAVLAGSFNPPTRAHLALGAAALGKADEVLFALPQSLPHKTYEGVDAAARGEMLVQALVGHPRFSAAVTEGGLFIEIARECRPEYPGVEEIAMLCGRDAAERIVSWEYGEDDSIERQLAEYSLLVAARQGVYWPPERLRGRIQAISMPEEFDWHSSTAVRERIGAGENWRELVPPSIHALVERYYS